MGFGDAKFARERPAVVKQCGAVFGKVRDSKESGMEMEWYGREFHGSFGFGGPLQAMA